MISELNRVNRHSSDVSDNSDIWNILESESDYDTESISQLATESEMISFSKFEKFKIGCPVI